MLAVHHVKPLSQERFNAFVAWARSPIVAFVGKEVEYFSDLDERVLGVVVRDVTDGDFGYVILGRDEKQRFRAIETNASLTHGVARAALLARLKAHHNEGTVQFSQDDEDGDNAGIDLFTPSAPLGKLHPSFDHVRQSDHFLPARSIMTEMMRHVVDVDGNFVEQFQTAGFDARVWELYLYAALLELGLFVSKPEPAPDFLVSDGLAKVFIEAVTVNSSGGEPPLRPADLPIKRLPEEIHRLNQTKIPIKYGSALWSKLKRKKPYWTLPDVQGHPLVFAIADFHEKQSMLWTSSGLFNYLYGLSHDFRRDENGQLIISAEQFEVHEYEGKKIPSGFFFQPDAENISAVLFSATGTMSKFNRMGRLAGFGHADQRMLRIGYKHKHDDNAAFPEPFCIEIAPGEAHESWAEGLSMFHNPRALHPVDPRMFPGVAHHFFENGKIVSILPEFHPYSSTTFNLLPDRGQAVNTHAG
ncbi:glycosaminoglycan attachment protein [Pseudoxanthomonas sacheonensis]|nr:glycosaminoglycan attachment protein [Pseudoxanthomonas sacheonensis]